MVKKKKNISKIQTHLPLKNTVFIIVTYISDNNNINFQNKRKYIILESCLGVRNGYFYLNSPAKYVLRYNRK